MWPPGISFDFEQTKEKLQESLKTRLESIRHNRYFESSKIFNSTIEMIYKNRETNTENKNEDYTGCVEIPEFLDKLFRNIEQEKHIVKEGLYRQNGNMADIQALRFAIEENKLEKLDAA